MKERRKYVRANGLVLVNYKIPDARISGKSSAFDISGSGVRITLEESAPAGSDVEMEIYLPGNSQALLAKGVISWTQKCREKAADQIAPKREYFFAGVKFTTIDENNRSRIVDYVHRKLH